MRNNLKLAFTLSEILIVVGLIGIVATMTITSLIKKSNQAQMLSQLKSAYSLLNNAVRLNSAEGVDVSDATIFINGVASTLDDRTIFLQNYIAPYFQVQASCSSTNVSSCASRYYFNINGTGGYQICTAILLKNGFTIGVSSTGGSPDLIVDINGKKGPNSLGKDVFKMSFDKAKKNMNSHGMPKAEMIY